MEAANPAKPKGHHVQANRFQFKRHSFDRMLTRSFSFLCRRATPPRYWITAMLYSLLCLRHCSIPCLWPQTQESRSKERLSYLASVLSMQLVYGWERNSLNSLSIVLSL
jgi:hypothetical protein